MLRRKYLQTFRKLRKAGIREFTQNSRFQRISKVQKASEKCK